MTSGVVQVSSGVCGQAPLQPGECYSIAGLTPTSHRLAILVGGRSSFSSSPTSRCTVSSPTLGEVGTVLPGHFLDSPEYQANQVTPCPPGLSWSPGYLSFR